MKSKHKQEINSSLVILDCESIKSTYDSISKIYSIKKNKIEKLLQELDLNEHYQKYDPPHPPNGAILRLFEKKFHEPQKTLDYVCWFHITRTFKNNKYKNGLLPLNKSLDIIWEGLFNRFQSTKYLERLKSLRISGIDDYQYQLKINNIKLLGGPYAILIKEIAFRNIHLGNQYLDFAEIIEDICNGYQKKYNECIKKIVKKSLVPCIVKFKSSKRVGKGCISPALYYLYKICHNEELSIYSNTCFDGEDKSIPIEDIIKIEYL